MGSDAKRWVWVCVQHPMPLLVEDRGEPMVLERIPPWGDASLEEYLKKFNDVFDSLERYPDFRMDFEISGRELEDVAAASPRTIERMRELFERGKIGFVGGDYSQSHCHVFGHESCLRQIVEGLATIRELIGCEVRVFFHQETGIHQQLPQILRAFGYTVAVPPRFPWAIRFEEGASPELTSHFGVVEFVRNQDMTTWKGLDGSAIPLYLSMPAPSVSDEIMEVFGRYARDEFRSEVFEARSPFTDFLHRERQKWPVTVPEILIETPDMKRLDAGYFENRARNCRFALISEALEEHRATATSTGAASLYSYWSYIEGVWAEELSRTNRRAETAAYQAEALDALRTYHSGGGPTDTRAIWKLILSSQHHDVYWIETTDLKRRALAWLNEAIARCRELGAESLATLLKEPETKEPPQERLLLVNTLPYSRSLPQRLRLPLPGDRPSAAGRLFPLPGFDLQPLPVRGGSPGGELVIAGEIPALGLLPCARVDRLGAPEDATVAFETRFYATENAHYSVEINRGGTISRLVEKQGGETIIGEGETAGNEITGRLSSGETVSNLDYDGNLSVTEGPLASIVSVEGRLGPIGLREEILLCKRSPCIDFRLSLDFGEEGLGLGSFWDDETKLVVSWPFASRTTVVHDIPYGVVTANPFRPLFATSFVDASNERAGLAYFNRGTTKHWFTRSVLSNVLAWGGRRFSNRHAGLWEHVDRYDLRLRGNHTIHYAILVHPGDYRTGDVPRRALEYTVPLFASYAKTSPASSPAEAQLPELAPHNLVCTSVAGCEEGMDLRLFEAFGEPVPLSRIAPQADPARLSLFDLRGRTIESIEPFQICTLRYHRARS